MVTVNGQTCNEELHEVKCHYVLLGGDQLTVKRAHSAIAQRSNSKDARGKLHGFVPFPQDWHARMCFLQVRYHNVGILIALKLHIHYMEKILF